MSDVLTPSPASVEAAQRRRARMAEQFRINKMARQLVTPEGAEINLKLGSFGERAGAFMIDIAIQWAIMLATFFGMLAVASTLQFTDAAGAGELLFGLWMVGYFLLRNFYFVFFELGRKAATPGKRALGLRVASRDGGQLTANAVLARNFMREIEFGLPLSFALSGGEGVSGIITLLGVIWSGIFLFFPLFNRDKLRVGDLIAGTWVIHAPKSKLMGDISKSAIAADDQGLFRFTPAQVDAYGIHELHVLEDVLRQSTPEIKAEVAGRIRAKIAWQSVQGETDLAFLEAYYAALRKRLEQRMLFGERKTDKFDQR